MQYFCHKLIKRTVYLKDKKLLLIISKKKL